VVRDAVTPESLEALAPEAAAALFIARRAEGLTEGEQHLLATWLAADAAHRQAFENADHAWRTFADAEGDEVLDAMRAHALAPRPRAIARWLPVAAAAAVLLAVAMPFVFPGAMPWSARSGWPQSRTAAISTYTSAEGEVKELQLPDGSSMTLDADSAVRVSFGRVDRKIELKRGRALFAVKPDRARPFIVSAAGRSVIAVGTRFDVNIVAEVLAVTLLEGKVDIASLSNGRALGTLEPGQQFVERGGEAEIRTIGAAVENAIAWKTGLISFDDQPLAEAVAIMNRYSRDKIVISAELVALKVSGQFRAGDSQRFATTFADMHRLRLTRQTNRIELDQEK
jgi:transmembrane sensor